MTRQEYEKKLGDVIAKTEAAEKSDIGKDLEQLEEYKPLRLSWYYAQARDHFNSTGNQDAVYEELSGKFTFSYSYPDVMKCLNFFRHLELSRENHFDLKRYAYIIQAMEGDFSYYETVNEKCRIVDEKSDPDSDFAAYWELYSSRELVGYMIHQRARWVKFSGKDLRGDSTWINDIPNMGYLQQELREDAKTPFIVIESERNGAVTGLICTDLKLLGKPVVFIKKPLQYEADGIKIADTVAVSVASMESHNGVITYVPVELVRQDGSREDNRGYLLHYIHNKYNDGKMSYVLADGDATDQLCRDKRFCKSISEILGTAGNGVHDKNLALSWHGDYLSYISKIYGQDCHTLVDEKPVKRFSIVIPARNSSDTLRYTLQTCLEQRYIGDYEIVVSDNSTGHNAAVYELCQKINDSRIVYLKTPRDLPLAKSFEYAYLHAKGEYIFAIGSDDGLLPWALEILGGIVQQYPDEEIIQWTRGFYAWPGFNGGQQHQFSIPRKYKKDEIPVGYREALDYIDMILKDPSNMYALPMLYINSCFKRSYFKTLLERTGRLWDGICQDIYMGVITACIHPQILNIGYPLTIAGMSPRSVGANANLGQKTNEEFEKMMQEVSLDNNMGGFCRTSLEQLIPDTGSDVCSMYLCILRAINIGVLPEQYLTEVFDWKKIFMDIFKLMDVRDVAYDRKLHEMRYAAMQHGEEFLKWFDEAIYEPGLAPRVIDEALVRALQSQRTYRCGTNAHGGVTLDASEYGVTNIYEAVKLFEKLTGL